MTFTTSFTIAVVSLSSLSTSSYQRERIESLVVGILANFDPAQWDLPKVVDKGDGTYRVVAGQHRVEAARAMLANGIWPFATDPGYIEVQVVSGISTIEEEAGLFLADASNTKPLSPYDKHNASIVHGEQRAIDIQSTLDTLGIPLVRRQRNANGHSLAAITAMNIIWSKGLRLPRDGGRTLVYETLRLASKWDPDDIYRFDGFVLQGLAAVLLEIMLAGGKMTRLDRFVAKNKPITIAGSARKWATSRGLSTNTVVPYAEAIRERL